MFRYIITYDLSVPESNDYKRLIAWLRKMEARHAQESVWILETESPFHEIRAQIEMVYIDPKQDSLLIYPLPEEGREYNSLND